jgi:general secretion pathway protein H
MRRAKGFTLIEVTVALAVAVMLFSSVVYGIGALTGAQAKEASTELANIIRSLYDTASLTGRTCRLVLELPEERENAPVKYHAECASGAITAAANRDDELTESKAKSKSKGVDSRRERDADRRLGRLDSDDAPTVQELQAREQKRVDDVVRFSQFESEDVSSRRLSSSVQVEVWTSKQRRPVKHGLAYLYFFPQGYTERAQLYVRQGSSVWTIVVSSLTGKTSVHGEEIEVPRS